MKQLKAFFIIILFYSSYLTAQVVDESAYLLLDYGTNHEDQITNLGEIDYYSFEGKKRDVIMIRMRDETKVDAYIKLYDPKGDLIASAWSDGGLAKIRNLELEKNGTYYIHAYDRNHNDVGNYGISLHQLNNSSYATQISEMTSFEDDIEQIVGANLYRFKADKDDVLFTQMRARTVHLECEFYIYDSKGEEIYKAENKGRLATVGPVKIDKSDSYTIVVTDRGGNDKDKFGLTHMLLNKHENAPELICGDNRTDQLTKLVQRNAFRLKARAGQIPLIEARSNNIVLETTMMIYDEKGNEIRKKSSTNKLISEKLEASNKDKSYLVVVFDRNGNDFGDFGVQVQFLDDSYCPDALNCSNSEENITFDGLAQSKLFSIEGRSGQPIEVILKETEPSLEPHIRVYDLEGEMIAEEYDGVKVDLSDKVFPYDGKYLILASDRSGNDLGDFTLEAPAGSELHLEIADCQTVYRGFTEEMSFADLAVEASGSNLQYLWSNGETTSSIHVCPLESTEFSVTVTNGSGCSASISSFVEVVDVSCGNGNGSPKVKVCHVKNNGDHQELCININGVFSHLYNGNGHENCHLGPCDHESPCDDGEGQTEELETETRSYVNKAFAFPNPTTGLLNINLGEEQSDDNFLIKLYNASGEVLLIETRDHYKEDVQIDLRNLNIPYGVYFLSVQGESLANTQKIIFLQ